MRELDHPNLVSIYDFYQDDPKFFYMVLELMEGGELFDRIVQKVRGSSSVESREWRLSPAHAMGLAII